jgi:hypothetical protein
MFPELPLLQHPESCRKVSVLIAEFFRIWIPTIYAHGLGLEHSCCIRHLKKREYCNIQEIVECTIIPRWRSNFSI